MTDTTSNPTAQLSAAGVSIWLDDLSRERIVSGGLEKLIDERQRRRRHHQPDDLRGRAREGRGLRRAGRRARRRRRRASRRRSSRSPPTTWPAAATSSAPSTTPPAASTAACRSRWNPASPTTPPAPSRRRKQLWAKVDRPNVMIKIPATQEGLEAITELIALGISVNVTLIFSLERYREVINAYLAGLEKAKDAGIDLSHDPLGRVVLRVPRGHRGRQAPRRHRHRRRPLALKGKAGIANARLAYQVYEQAFATRARASCCRRPARTRSARCGRPPA